MARKESEKPLTRQSTSFIELSNTCSDRKVKSAYFVKSQNDKLRERVRAFAKELHDAKMLSEEGWKRAERADSPKVITL